VQPIVVQPTARPTAMWIGIRRPDFAATSAYCVKSLPARAGLMCEKRKQAPVYSNVSASLWLSCNSVLCVYRVLWRRRFNKFKWCFWFGRRTRI